MVSIEESINLLAASGFIENVVPFFLLFTLVYVALSMKIFGTKRDKDGKEVPVLPQNLRVVISASFALLMLGVHYTSPGSQYDIVPIMNMYLADFALIILAVLFVLMGMGLTGMKMELEYGYYFTIASVILVTYLLLTYSGAIPSFSGLSSDTVSAVIALLVFFLLVKFMTGGDKKP